MINLDQFKHAMTELLDAAPDAMVLVDSQRRIIATNVLAENLFGYQDGEMLGRRIEMLLPERFQHTHQHHAESYIAKPHRRNMGEGQRLYARRKDGRELPVEVSLSPVHTDGGLIVISAIRDVTARIRIQEDLERKAAALERSNADLEHFAFVASHDLQEPLRAVASFAQLLSRRYTGKLDTDADEFIKFIVDGASHMQFLINDLLTYSRITTRGKPLRPTDCNTVVDVTLRSLLMAIKSSDANIHVSQLPTLLADERQLTQLFQNLIANALKFTKPGQPPHITIGAQWENDHHVLFVKDDGIGIDPQYAERIFTLFQRLHNKQDYPGTGIGLAVCKKIVERHGGRIWVESAINQGATFFFTLPADSSTAVK